MKPSRRLIITSEQQGAAIRALLLARVKKDCWLWDGPIDDEGYGTFTLNGQTYLAHRASYEAHKGPIPDDLILRHTCDVRPCINPDHLVPGTYEENNDDIRIRGGSRFWYAPRNGDHRPRGVDHLYASFTTEDQVAQYRRRFLVPGTRIDDLARDADCSNPTMRRMLLNQTYPDPGYAPPCIGYDGRYQVSMTPEQYATWAEYRSDGAKRLRARERQRSKRGSTRRYGGAKSYA